jgi:stage II sporulation protein D
VTARGLRPGVPAAVRALAVALGLVLVVPAVPAAADERITGPVRVAGGVRFTPDASVEAGRDPLEAPVEVTGLGPRRFLGTVELLPRRTGIDVVNELPFDTYLYGLAEVPRSWPRATLEAQVIAARTYAWHVMGLTAYRDHDICATTACQVFRGAEVLLASRGARWRRAVDDTSGQVLLFEREPILARYFSTSGGRTYANEHVFPSSGPRPYLTGIQDPLDELSPLHRWEVRFTRAEFDALLAQGRRLRAVTPFADVERLGAVDDPRAEIRVTGADGRRVDVRAIELRDFLSARAAELDPERFPSRRSDGAARLPSVIPTTRYAIGVEGDEVVIEGYGWGHGVGMGQWGAHARALAGQDAAEILAAYYGGIRPTADPRVPATIRAGMGAATLDVDDDGRPTGMRVTLVGPGDVRDCAGRLIARGLGTWTVDRVRTPAGTTTGTTLFVTPPAGHGAPLEVAPTTIHPGLAWGPGRELGSVHPGESGAVDVRTVVSKPVLLRLEARRLDDDTVTWTRELGLAEQGAHWIRVFAGDAPGVSAATHRFVLVGTDVTGATAGG